MPVIHVYHPEGSLYGERKAALAQCLTDAMLEMEGGARTTGGIAFASVLFTQVPTPDWWVGGRTDSTYVHPPGKFIARIDVPEGYMSQVDKTNVHGVINKAIVEVAGSSDARGQGASVMVIINEVGEGNWGVQGETISLANIAEAVGLPKEGGRFHFVREYFAAKARLFAMVRFPSGTGGLMKEEVRPDNNDGH